MKSIGASFLKLVPARDDADRARGGDEPPERGEAPIVEDLIAVARAVTPSEERDGAESAPDRILRFFNRMSDGLLFTEIESVLEAALAREGRRLDAPRPARDAARTSHGRIAATLAQFHLQLGRVDRGVEVLRHLNGSTSSTDLAFTIASLEDVLGVRTADDAMTTCIRLREKSRSPTRFRTEETAGLLADEWRLVRTPRNRSKLQWRGYVCDALGGRSPERARYEDDYLKLASGGSSPGMPEASLKGTLIYDLCMAGRPEDALDVSKRTRALIMPLWDGVDLLPRMTSHMILCHFHLLLHVIAEVASRRLATSLQEECEGWIMAIRCDMREFGITEKADGFWEAEAVLAAMPPRGKVRVGWPETPGCDEPRKVVSHYEDVVDRLTRECEALAAHRPSPVALPSIFSDGPP